MKVILWYLLLAVLLAGCGSQSAEPQFTDTGSPGEIRVILFVDGNRNGIKDQGEEGIPDSAMVIQHDSCPPPNVVGSTRLEADDSGEILFPDLAPGRYCVSYMGSRGTTTRLVQTVDLSSDQVVRVYYGIAAE